MLPRLTITFRHLSRSGAIESTARELGHRLQLVHDRISACRIVIEGRTNPQWKTGDYAVRIHISVPGAEVHANSALSSGEMHLDARTALRAAYDDAKRQLAQLQQRPAQSNRAAVQPAGNIT